MTFNHYSEYYDLLYQDKDYLREVGYIQKLLNQYQPACQSILELGCGTGLHGSLLSQQGFHITGIEISETMLAVAKSRSLANSFRFTAIHGDARTLRLPQTFDAVISLFHVASYQTSNEDILAMFATASVHLEQNGLFIFDTWYGPAVLADRPTVRTKQMENERASVTRLAEPTIDVNQNIVDVNYTLQITDKRTGSKTSLRELHRMRYFFLPELQLLAASSGFHLIHSEEWLTSAAPSDKSWGVTFLCQKQ